MEYPNEKWRLISGIVFSLICGIGLASVNNWYYSEAYEIALYLIVFAYLEYAFSESFSFSRITIIFLVSGLSLGLSIFLTKFLGSAIYFNQSGLENRNIELALYLLRDSIFIPLIEEKLVRSLIYSGLKKYISPLIASVITSVTFGLAHNDSELLIFGVSMFLCFLTEKGVDVYNRSIFHGAYNFAITA